MRASTRPLGRLHEKGPYQAVYAEDGHLLRLLHDADGDKVADVVVLYGPDGTPLVGEIDTDQDGVVDRWEQFVRGKLVRVLLDSDRDGRPDQTLLP